MPKMTGSSVKKTTNGKSGAKPTAKSADGKSSSSSKSSRAAADGNKVTAPKSASKVSQSAESRASESRASESKATQQGRAILKANDPLPGVPGMVVPPVQGDLLNRDC